MSERNQVQELTDALTSLRVDLNKVAQQIDAKAATPAQLAELAKAIKAADAAGIAASVERAGELAGQSIERKVERRINAAATDLRTASARLPALENTLSETTAALAAAITETKKAGEWLNLRAALVLVLAVVLVVVGSVASLGWQEQQTANLKAQAAALTVQIAQERATVATLDAKGGHIQWAKCGGRLCFQAAPNQGISHGKSLFTNWGGWIMIATKAPLVIPDGY